MRLEVEAHVYTEEPASTDALVDCIVAFIREKPAEMSERVCQNWTKGMIELRHSRCQYLHKNNHQTFIYFFVGKTKAFKKEIFRKFIARLKIHICVVHETFHLNHALAPHNS